jgi:hypothetical protein
VTSDQYRLRRPPARPRPPRVESSDEFLVRHGLLPSSERPPPGGTGRPGPPGRALPPPGRGAPPGWPAALGGPTTQRDEVASGPAAASRERRRRGGTERRRAGSASARSARTASVPAGRMPGRPQPPDAAAARQGRAPPGPRRPRACRRPGPPVAAIGHQRPGRRARPHPTQRSRELKRRGADVPPGGDRPRATTARGLRDGADDRAGRVGDPPTGPGQRPDGGAGQYPHGGRGGARRGAATTVHPATGGCPLRDGPMAPPAKETALGSQPAADGGRRQTPEPDVGAAEPTADKTRERRRRRRADDAARVPRNLRHWPFGGPHPGRRPHREGARRSTTTARRHDLGDPGRPAPAQPRPRGPLRRKIASTRGRRAPGRRYRRDPLRRPPPRRARPQPARQDDATGERGRRRAPRPPPDEPGRARGPLRRRRPRAAAGPGRGPRLGRPDPARRGADPGRGGRRPARRRARCRRAGRGRERPGPRHRQRRLRRCHDAGEHRHRAAPRRAGGPDGRRHAAPRSGDHPTALRALGRQSGRLQRPDRPCRAAHDLRQRLRRRRPALCDPGRPAVTGLAITRFVAVDSRRPRPGRGRRRGAGAWSGPSSTPVLGPVVTTAGTGPLPAPRARPGAQAADVRGEPAGGAAVQRQLRVLAAALAGPLPERAAAPGRVGGLLPALRTTVVSTGTGWPTSSRCRTGSARSAPCPPRRRPTAGAGDARGRREGPVHRGADRRPCPAVDPAADPAPTDVTAGRPQRLRPRRAPPPTWAGTLGDPGIPLRRR